MPFIHNEPLYFHLSLECDDIKLFRVALLFFEKDDCSKIEFLA